MDESLKHLLNTLGMARRAGVLIIGQDEVCEEMKKHAKLLVITANDCAQTVLRSVHAHEALNEAVALTIKDADRTMLGAFIGIKAAQILALPMDSGFAKKFISLYDRSDANE